MRELTVNELQDVSGGTGGMTQEQAGQILQSYAAGIIGGAAVGALMGGPAGIFGGILLGAGRAAVGGGIAALILGTFHLH